MDQPLYKAMSAQVSLGVAVPDQFFELMKELIKLVENEVTQEWDDKRFRVEGEPSKIYRIKWKHLVLGERVELTVRNNRTLSAQQRKGEWLDVLSDTDRAKRLGLPAKAICCADDPVHSADDPVHSTVNHHTRRGIDITGNTVHVPSIQLILDPVVKAYKDFNGDITSVITTTQHTGNNRGHGECNNDARSSNR